MQATKPSLRLCCRPTIPEGVPDALVGELEKLAELHDQGVLESDEFEALKVSLLGLAPAAAPASGPASIAPAPAPTPAAAAPPQRFQRASRGADPFARSGVSPRSSVSPR